MGKIKSVFFTINKGHYIKEYRKNKVTIGVQKFHLNLQYKIQRARKSGNEKALEVPRTDIQSYKDCKDIDF